MGHAGNGIHRLTATLTGLFGLVTQMRNLRIVSIMNSPAVQSLHLIFYYLPMAPFFARHWRKAAISLTYPISDALY